MDELPDDTVINENTLTNGILIRINEREHRGALRCTCSVKHDVSYMYDISYKHGHEDDSNMYFIPNLSYSTASEREIEYAKKMIDTIMKHETQCMRDVISPKITVIDPQFYTHHLMNNPDLSLCDNLFTDQLTWSKHFPIKILLNNLYDNVNNDDFAEICVPVPDDLILGQFDEIPESFNDIFVMPLYTDKNRPLLFPSVII